MSQVFQDTLIKQAVIEQIKNATNSKTMPLSWQTETLSAILGIKREKGKRVPYTKFQLLEVLKQKINGLLGYMDNTASISEVKEFIKNGGNESLILAIKSVPFTRFTDEPTEQDIKDNVEKMLGLLTLEQAWGYLSMCNSFDFKTYSRELNEKQQKLAEKKKKQEKASGSGKSNYISIDNDEAKQILASYYSSLASGASVTTPECFRAAGLSNPSTVLKRFIYTHYNQEQCKEANSINENVYKLWKSKEPDFTLEEANDIENNFFKTVQPDFKDKIDSWKDATYIAGCIKKDDKVEKLKKAIATVTNK